MRFETAGSASPAYSYQRADGRRRGSARRFPAVAERPAPPADGPRPATTGDTSGGGIRPRGARRRPRPCRRATDRPSSGSERSTKKRAGGVRSARRRAGGRPRPTRPQALQPVPRTARDPAGLTGMKRRSAGPASARVLITPGTCGDGPLHRLPVRSVVAGRPPRGPAGPAPAAAQQTESAARASSSATQSHGHRLDSASLGG